MPGPEHRRPLGWLLNWGTARRVLLAAAALATLAAIYFTAERFRGQKDWAAYKRTAAETGHWLALDSFAQPPLPEEQDFAAAPLLKTLAGPAAYSTANSIADRIEALSQGRQPTSELDNVRWMFAQPVDLGAWRNFWSTDDLLQPLQKFAPELAELAQAARRPGARLFDWRHPSDNTAPLQSTLVRLARLLELRALAQLAKGDTPAAGEDALTLLLLVKHLSSTPNLGYQLTALSIEPLAIQVLWEGLAARRWADPQLQAFQGELARIDFLRDGLRAWEAEETYLTAVFEQAIDATPADGNTNSLRDGIEDLARSYPRGWLYQNFLRYRQIYERDVFPAFDIAHHRLDPSAVRALDAKQKEIAERSSFYTKLLTRLLPNFRFLLMQLAAGQAEADEALVACALERYRLANGKFPETLEMLKPDFLPQIPVDVNTGQPLRYRCLGEENFVLYSIGPDGQDNGGIVFMKQGAFADIGDWAWGYFSKDIVK